MSQKLLLPNAKMVTINQIMNMSMRQVFNHLKALAVAEESQYKEFMRGDSPSPRSRRRRAYSYPKRSPKIRYIYGKKSPEYWYVYKKKSPARTIPRPPPLPPRRSPRRSPRRLPRGPPRKIPSITVGPRGGMPCPTYRTLDGCNAAGCYWTGASCLTR